MTNTATPVGFPAEMRSCTAITYRLDPPMTWGRWGTDDNDDYVELPATTEFVVVSDIDNEFGTETYIFASDAEGTIRYWGELPGSFRGGRDHAVALASAGYRIVE